MNLCEFIWWIRMNLYEFSRVLWIPHYFRCIPMNFLWSPMNSYDFLWIVMNFELFSTNSYNSYVVFVIPYYFPNFYESLWNSYDFCFMKCYEFVWIFMNFYELLWISYYSKWIIRMKLYKFLWIRINSEFLWIPLKRLCFFEFLQIRMNLYEIL